MCGIVGVVMKARGSGLYKKHEDSFFELLFADQVRGEDSTGIIGVEKDGTFHVAKEATKASEFIPKFKALPACSAIWNSGMAYIGHNRKKTVGSISDDTAHPFVVDETFAMVHNGTLEQHHKLAKNCSVDSEALAIHLKAYLNKEGDVAKNIEDALGYVQGAYAVAMYDQKKHQVILTRNKERPLALIETDDAWYFMSESLMGAWILSRAQWRYDYSKLKVSAINEHEVVIFDLEKGGIKREQLTPKKQYTSSYQTTKSGNNSWSNTIATGNGGSNTTSGNSPKKGIPCTDSEYKLFRKEWLGKRVTVVVNDLLEDDYPTERLEYGNVGKLHLYANAPCLWWAHCVTITVDAKKAGIKTAEDVLGKKWVVDIEECHRSTHGTIVIEGGDPKPVVSSLVKLKGNETNAEFRSQLAKLDYEELHAMAEEVKYSGSTWQINAVNSEICWRDGISSLQQAHDMAKRRKTVLIQGRKDGKFIYRDSEGNIYYECAIALQ